MRSSCPESFAAMESYWNPAVPLPPPQVFPYPKHTERRTRSVMSEVNPNWE